MTTNINMYVEVSNIIIKKLKVTIIFTDLQKEQNYNGPYKSIFYIYLYGTIIEEVENKTKIILDTYKPSTILVISLLKEIFYLYNDNKILDKKKITISRQIIIEEINYNL